MVDAAFYALLQRQSFVRPSYNDNDFSGLWRGQRKLLSKLLQSTYIKNSLYAYRQRHLRHLVQIIPEEPRIGYDRVVRKRLHSCPAPQARTRLIECNVPIGSYPAKEELNAAGALDFFFIRYALLFKIFCISVQDVDVCWVDVDMAEEVLVHERVVGLRMIARDADVFVLLACEQCSSDHS